MPACYAKDVNGSVSHSILTHNKLHFPSGLIAQGLEKVKRFFFV
jgi:hypothetical protein